MACDGLFFRSVATTNRRHVPAAALVAQGFWASLLVLPVTVTPEPKTGVHRYGNLYNDLLAYMIPVDLTFYALMVGAVIALRLKAPSCPAVSDDRLPVPAVLYIGLALLLVRRLHLSEACHIGDRIPDCVCGYSRLSGLVAPGRAPARAGRDHSNAEHCNR